MPGSGGYRRGRKHRPGAPHFLHGGKQLLSVLSGLCHEPDVDLDDPEERDGNLIKCLKDSQAAPEQDDEDDESDEGEE